MADTKGSIRDKQIKKEGERKNKLQYRTIIENILN